MFSDFCSELEPSDGCLLESSDGCLLESSDGCLLESSDGCLLESSDGCLLESSDGCLLESSDGCSPGGGDVFLYNSVVTSLTIVFNASSFCLICSASCDNESFSSLIASVI